jgi:hypothetical protein
VAVPLLGEDADRRRAAADAHPLFALAVHDGARRLHDDARAAVDRQFDGCLFARRSIASHVTLPSFFEPPVSGARRRARASASRIRRRDVADRLAVDAHRRQLRAEEAVGVDLHLEPQ